MSDDILRRLKEWDDVDAHYANIRAAVPTLQHWQPRPYEYAMQEWLKPCEETDGLCSRLSVGSGWECSNCGRELPEYPEALLVLHELLTFREFVRGVVTSGEVKL